ncbi:unnamed protein product [Phytophthora lilii]|uniref:Unnamed protein product n=1 Tax=Phytophthora lilii TaxID=2077276 RepID=A0A9W6UEV4_9STRA|nr:unnamed protein product [Phytophthora lilii]
MATSTSTPASSAAGEDDSSPGTSATSGNGNGNGNGKSNDKSVDNANENGREHGKKATSTSTPASSAAGEDDSSPGTSATSGSGNGNGNGKGNDKSVDNANENGRENLSVDSNAVALNVPSDAANGQSKIEELGAASEVPKGLNAATMGNTLSNTDATSEDAAGTGVSNSHVTPSSSHDELTPANTVVPDTDPKVTPGELSTEPNTMDTASPFKSNDHASTAEKENRTSTSANTAADISPDPDTQITKDTTIETASTSTDAPSSTSKAQTLSGIPKKLSNKGNAEETPALSDAVLNDAAKSNAKSDDQHLRGSPTSDSATVLVRTAPATQANSASVSTLSQTATKMTPNTKESSSNGGHGKTTRTDMMSIETMDAATQNAQQYVRGDPMFSGIDGESGSSVFTEEGDGSAPLVIGGRKRGWQVEAQSGLYAASSSFQNGLRFLVCAAALISVILLMLFHFEVLNDGLNRHLPPQVTWNPNAWEFLLYTQYIQQIAVISALTLLKTPYFLWDFTDLFSWTNFLVYHAQDEPSSSGRRLTTIILGGLVGYGDRIGTNEVSLLKHASAGFGLVVGFFLGVVIGAILLKKSHWRNYKSEKIGILWRCLGLVLLVWFFSLLPLSMMTSFEVSMQFKAQVLELWPLTIAFAVIVLVFFGMILVAARAILHRSERYLSALRSRAIWGAFYSDCTYAGRLFFLLTVAQQICMGLCIGILDDSQLILVLLVTLHVVFVVAVLWARPFLNGSSQAKNATYAVSLLRLVNLALAFAFLPSSTLTVSSLYRVANAVIGLNSLVIVSWCIRHLFIFGRLVVASAKLEIEDRQTQQAETAMEASPSLLLSYELITKPQ